VGNVLLAFLRASGHAFGALELIVEDEAGNRSFIDEGSNGNGPEDETTVVEPEQGNGMPDNTSNKFALKLMIYYSPLTHHIAATTRCGPEPSCASNVYFGATQYAGEDHEVRFLSTIHPEKKRNNCWAYAN
jgi:hypothetical protein